MRPRAAIRLFVVFAAYLVSAKVGLALDAVNGFATLVWAPTGISLAAMLAWGLGVWPAVALGAAVVNLFAGAPLPVALGIAAGNTAEALVGAWLLRSTNFDARLQRLSDVLGLICLGAVVSTLIAASVGVLSLWAGGITAAGASGRAWRAWWIGDLMGALVVAPPILVWWTRPPIKKRPHFVAEAALAVLAVSAMVALVFGNRRLLPELRVPAYMLFPVLLIVATRFGQYGAATANLAVTAAAIAFTALDYGPFVVTAGLSENLLRLQMLMGILAITTLVLGAAIAERDRAVEAREEFLSVASHELRTPLTSLSLQLQFLSRASAAGNPLPPGQVLTTASAALRQARKLARLIGELLDVSRITAGRLRLAPVQLDLGELVREVASSYEEQTRRAGFAISIECDGECKGFWDRERLEQVVDNLFSNAVKYGDGKPIDVAVRGTDAGVLVAVRDRGIGIASADHGRIFGQFERGASSRRYAGVGLGLWIAQRIVEAHQGRIRVESAPGEGTTFLVELQRESLGRVESAHRALPGERLEHL